MRFHGRLKIVGPSGTVAEQPSLYIYELPEITLHSPENWLNTYASSPTTRADSDSTSEPLSTAYSALKAAALASGTIGVNSRNIGQRIYSILNSLGWDTFRVLHCTLYMSMDSTASRFTFGTNSGMMFYNEDYPNGTPGINNGMFMSVYAGNGYSDFDYFYVYLLSSDTSNYKWVVWQYKIISTGRESFYCTCCWDANHSPLTPAYWTSFYKTFDGAEIPPGTPYPNLPPSGGGDEISDGTQDWSSDDVPDPPSLIEDATDTGFTRIYNPTLAQLQDFARYMWTDTNIFNTVWSIVARYFEDPMDAFISLSILPIEIPNTTNPVEVKMLFLPTGKQMYAATQQFVTVELGSVNLSELWGSALDYAPNTKIDLFLPYIGTVPVDPDEVMGKTVKVTYKVDICTGCCVAIVSVKLTKSDGTDTWAPLYQLSGNCAIQIPFTGANMDRYVDAALKTASIALTAGAGIAAGAAAGVAAAAPSMAESTTAAASMASHQMNFTTPTTSGAVFPQQQVAASQAAKYNRKATAMRGLSTGLGIVSGAKPQFQHSSPFTANSGYMSYRVPFFIIKSPRLVNPDQYGKYNGYPSLTFQQFSALEGYAEIQQVQLTNINATANELDEIQSLLKTGVIM